MALGGDGDPPRPGGSRRIVSVSWNANDLNARKRREIEMFKKEMDVLGVQETRMKGNRMLECKAGGDCGRVWRGEWCGVE